MAERKPLDAFFKTPSETNRSFPPLNPSRGVSRENPVAETVVEPEEKKKGFLERAISVGKKVTDTLGLSGTADTLGTNIANIKNVLNPKTSLEEKVQMSKDLPQTTLKQNIGAGFQLGSMLNPVGGEAGLLKTAVIGAGEGAAIMGGGAATEGKETNEILSEAKSGAKIGGILGTAGKALGSVGKVLYKSIIPRGTREAQLLQAYKANTPLLERIRLAATGTSKSPITVGETAFNKGLLGTESMLGVQAKQAKNTLWNDLVQPALTKADKQVEMKGFFDAVEDKIVSQNPDFTRRAALLEALQALRDDFANFRVADLSQLQKFKEGWAKFIPDKAYKGKPIGAAFKEVQDAAADEARDTIYTVLGPEVNRAYLDYGNLLAIEELGVKAMTGGKLKGGAGSFLSGIYEMALTPVATIGGKVIYKTGEGITLVGPPGVGTLGQLLETPDSEEGQQETPPPTGRRPIEEFQR